jgi:hypothetical protein
MAGNWIGPNRPEGTQLFQQRVYVAGCHAYPGTRRFAAGKRLRLELQPEPKNKHDSNAIKVIGVSRGIVFSRRYHIGYVPKDLALAIVKGGFLGKVGADLRMVESGEHVNVVFDLYGPKGLKKQFDSALCEHGANAT